MTIYIDVVLFENLIMNYIILLATGIILKIKIKHLRLIIASLIGAIYSIFGYIKYKSIFKYDIKNNTFNNNNICSL